LLALIPAAIRSDEPTPLNDALPDRAVARLGVVRPRWNYVTAHAFPTPTTLVTADDSLNVYTWDLATGRILRHLQFPCKETAWPKLSPDGKFLAARDWGGKTIRRFNLEWDHAYSEDLTVPDIDSLWEFDVSPGGWSIAGIAHTKKSLSAHLWDRESSRAIPLHVGPGYIQPPRFSPDGSTVVAFVEDVPRCWKGKGGATVWTGERARNVDPTTLCFTPDGDYIVARSSISSSSPIWWNAHSGKLVPASEIPIDFGPLSRLPVFSANGRTIVTVQEGQKIQVRDGKTGRVKREIANVEGVLGLSPDGRYCAGWLEGSAPQCWDTETGKPLWPEIPDRAHAGGVNTVAFSPNGRLFVSVGADGIARIWDVAKRSVLAKFPVAPDAPIVFSRNGEELYLCGTSDIIQWDTAHNKSIRRLKVIGWALEQTKGFVGTALSRDEKSVAAIASVGKDEWIISAWSVATGEQTLQNKLILQGDHLALWPGDAMLMQRGHVCNRRSGDVLFTIDPPRDDLAFRWCGRSVFAHSAAIAVCASELATPAVDANVVVPQAARPTPAAQVLCVLDTDMGRVIQTIQPDKPGRFELSSNGRWLAIVEPQGFGVWETGSGRHVLSVTQSGVRSLAFGPDNRTVATGLANGCVIIWDLLRDKILSKPGLPEAEIPATWSDLNGSDVVRGYAALWRLANTQEGVVPFLAARMAPAPLVSDEHLRKLIADLDSNRFAARESASRELSGLGDRALPALRAANNGRLSLEAQWRMERLLNQRFVPLSLEKLSFLRGIEVLERIGTPEARHVLVKLSEGDPRVLETRAAREALQRLNSR
jgi:WD40 repeat protein